MIEGLKIDVTSEELRTHLDERAKYHRQKADWYASQIEALQSGGLDRSRGSNDPLDSLGNSMKAHRDKTSYFAFLAQHLITGETYRLSQDDLSAIEVASRYFPGLFR
jgi:hypothetical protein